MGRGAGEQDKTIGVAEPEMGLVRIELGAPGGPELITAMSVSWGSRNKHSAPGLKATAVYSCRQEARSPASR